MSKILANQIANYGDNSPVEVKEGVNIPAGKPLQAAGTSGSSGQLLSSTGSTIQWIDAFDRDYNSLTNLPNIPAAQVQSDWNAVGGISAILNKPIIPPQNSVNVVNASGSGNLSFNGANGEFTFTPPDLSGLASKTEGKLKKGNSELEITGGGNGDGELKVLLQDANASTPGEGREAIKLEAPVVTDSYGSRNSLHLFEGIQEKQAHIELYYSGVAPNSWAQINAHQTGNDTLSSIRFVSGAGIWFYPESGGYALAVNTGQVVVDERELYISEGDLKISDGNFPIKFHVENETGNVTAAGTLTAGGLTYPAVNGTAGQVLTSDGAGNVTWDVAIGTLQEVTTRGNTTTEQIIANGGVKALNITSGTVNDLEFKHDNNTSKSYISHTNTTDNFYVESVTSLFVNAGRDGDPGGVYLQYNDSTKLSVTASGVQVGDLYVSGTTDLTTGDLDDVDLSVAPTDGQVLKWDDASSKWKAANDLQGSGAGLSLEDFSVATLTAGTTALTYNSANGVFSYTPPDLSNYDTAYGWGDHANAGYLTSETDPVFSAHVASNILQTNINNWNTAYSWGNHASIGYLTATSTDKTNWNTAYGWGDHSTAGYLTTESSTFNDVLTRANSTVSGFGTFGGTAWSSNAAPTGAVNVLFNNMVLFENDVFLNLTGDNFKWGWLSGGMVWCGENGTFETDWSDEKFELIHWDSARPTGANYDLQGALYLKSYQGYPISIGNDSGPIQLGNNNGSAKYLEASATATKLYLNDVEKLKTTSAGIEVTGDINFTGNLYQNGNQFQSGGGGGGGASVTISDTAPGSPSFGDLWWESDKGRLKIYYNDTDSFQWVDASPPLSPTNLSNGDNLISTTGLDGSGFGVQNAIEFSTDNNGSAGLRWRVTTAGHLLPATNDTYDIGNAEFKVRHMFLSDNTLYYEGDFLKVAQYNSGESAQSPSYLIPLSKLKDALNASANFEAFKSAILAITDA